MSSPLDRSYKSRVFTFVNYQYQKLKTTSTQALRRVKLTVEWSAQILLYPIYILVQTGRLVERQLQQRLKPTNLLGEFTSSEEPQPIEATLTEIESYLPSQENFHSLGIKSLASDLSTQKLLLVKEDQSTVDIFNASEQEKINKIILKNVANYYLLKKEQEQLSLVKKFPRHLGPIKADNEKIIPPIRLFWQTMAWIQNSSVAKEVNLFGESSLALLNYWNTILSDRHISPHDVWESKQINFKIQELIAKAIDYFFGDNSKIQKFLSFDELVNTLPASKQIQLNSHDDLENLNYLDQNSLKALIKAALIYFLNQFLPTLHKGEFSQQSSYINSIKDYNLENQWLSWEDLFQPQASNNIFRDIELIFPDKQLQKQENITLNIEKPLIYSHQTSSTTAQKTLDIEETTDYLETKVLESSYIEHPLAKVLKWLDSLMFKIENICVNIWHLLQKKIF